MRFRTVCSTGGDGRMRFVQRTSSVSPRRECARGSWPGGEVDSKITLGEPSAEGLYDTLLSCG